MTTPPASLGYVLVTGCSSGIGRAAAVGLLAKGYQVIAATRTLEQATALAADTGLVTVVIDNENCASVHAGWEAALAISGSIGIGAIFANAGYGQAGALEDITWDALEQQLKTNVLGTHELVRLAVQHMRYHSRGRIVICSSVLGIVGLRFRGAYVASKFCLEGMADVWRNELHGTGIHVSLLEPGPVLTRFRQNSLLAFQRHVDPKNSNFSRQYENLVRRLSVEGPVAPFTGLAQDGVQYLEHAFLSRSPRARYRWTVQTKVFAFLKRILPTRWLDHVTRRG